MPSAKNLQILVVDDQQSMRELTRHCLKQLGVNKIEVAKSGEEALGILGKTKFDLIVSDWNMDGISGLELLTKIRNNPVIKKLPFIMATGQKEKSQIMAAKEAGANNYVVKPFSAADLRKRIEAVLGALE
jgi:two-component system chemotaxis response regulator CheY